MDHACIVAPLGAIPIRALMARHPGLDWAAVTDVVCGCANQAGEDNRNVARMSDRLSGLPIVVTTDEHPRETSMEALAKLNALKWT